MDDPVRRGNRWLTLVLGVVIVLVILVSVMEQSLAPGPPSKDPNGAQRVLDSWIRGPTLPSR